MKSFKKFVAESFNLDIGAKVSMKKNGEITYGKVIGKEKVLGKPGVEVKWDSGQKGRFPMSDFSALSMDKKADYVREEIELDEQKQPYIVVDTADGNKVVGMASDERGAKMTISSAERPPMSIKDKSTLKIVKSNKKQYIGMPLKEEVELDELDTTTLQRYKTKASRDIENSTDEKKVKKRGKGYALASKKLTSRILAKESAELDEAVEVRHDRYMRSHGKKASGGTGSWMFTHKNMGDVDYNNEKEVYSAPRGKFSDAKKAAQQWGKKHGHSTVYVMEEVELDEGIGGLFKNASEWEKSAKARGLVVKPATHPSGEATKYHIAKDKQGNNRGYFDHGIKSGRLKEEMELDEVSTEKLRSYASAALQDKNKAKAGKRWKYASKAMNTVADREVKAAHARKYNKMEETELDEKMKLDEEPILGPKGATNLARSADQSDREYIHQSMFKNKWKSQNPGKKWPGYSKAGYSHPSYKNEESELDEGYLKYGVDRVPEVYVNRMPKTLQDSLIEYEGTRNSEMFAFTRKLKTREVESLAKAVNQKLNIYSVKYHGSNKTSGPREVFVYEVKK
jgi:hypothetical protein